MNSDVKSILYNVLGGIIVSILSVIYISLRYRCRSYNLQRLLGFKFKPETAVRMIYGQFILPELFNSNGGRITHPYTKPLRRGTPSNMFISIEHPVSECEVRASVYVSTLLGSSKNLQTIFTSDMQVDTLLDSNFISFGGRGSNYKTADILVSEANIFIRDTGNGLSLIGGDFPNVCTSQIDHGFILRLTPPGFPGRSWLICAGLNEWGTSGSAWFLAHRWSELIKRIHPLAYHSKIMRIPDFLAVIRVTPGQDQSAQMIQLYRNNHGNSRRVI